MKARYIIYLIILSPLLLVSGVYAQVISTFKAHTRSYGLEDVAISPDGKLIATGGQDGKAALWDLEGHQLFSLEASSEGEKIYSVAFSPKGKIVATGGSDDQVKIWEVKSGKLLETLPTQDRIHDLKFSPDGSLLVVSQSYNHVEVWKTKGWAKYRQFRTRGISCLEAAISPDNQTLIASGGAGLVKSWNLENGEELPVFEDLKYEPSDVPKPQGVARVRYSPDGTSFFTAADGNFNYNNQPRIQLWDLSGKRIQAFHGFIGSFDFAISADQKYLIVGGNHHNEPAFGLNNGNINVYDIASGDLVASIEAHQNGIHSLALSPDGKYLVSGGGKDREVKLWDAPQLLATRNASLPTKAGGSSPTDNPNPDPVVTQDFDPDEFEALLQGQDGPAYYALVISVQNYDSESIKDLQGPEKDAQALKTILQNNYTFDAPRVTFLRDPRRSEIIKALDELSRTIRPQDNLLIFYAGHGHWDATLEQGYWLPADAEKESRANWLANSEISNYVRGIKTQHTLLITDACFGGSIFESNRALSEAPKHIQNLYERQSRKAMTSGTQDEEVPDKSYFTEYLIKGLSQNREKFVSASTLFGYLREPVLSNTETAPMHEVIRNTGHEGGDFIFVKR